jgi:transcriptional regulator with XRE-family HTH domain
MRLAELLKQCRRRTGLSANDVADRGEVGRSYYFEIEQGKRANISLLIAARLSQVLKVSLKDLAAAALNVGREKRRTLERGRFPRTSKGGKSKQTKQRPSKDPLGKLRVDFDALVAKMQTPQAEAAYDRFFAASGKELGAIAHSHAKAAQNSAKKENQSRAHSDSRRRKSVSHGAAARK